MTASLVIDALNMAAWTRRRTTIDGLICPTTPGVQTRRFFTPGVSTTSVPLPPSGPLPTVSIMRAESIMGLFKTELHRSPSAVAANAGSWEGLGLASGADPELVAVG